MKQQFEGRFREELRLKNGSEELELQILPESEGSLQIFIEESCHTANIRITSEELSRVRVYLQKEGNSHLDLTIANTVMKDARQELGYLDLTGSSTKLDFLSALRESGATSELYTGELCLEGADKINTIKTLHETGHTYGNMHNFSVVFDKGVYKNVCDGTIGKGCPGSESHQETRVLTMGTGHKAEVIPILYIDENDVKASHALTIGQPDAQQLYYLCSRGLSAKQAVGLLSIGYFLPVLDFVDDEKLHDELRADMERRVGLYEHQ